MVSDAAEPAAVLWTSIASSAMTVIAPGLEVRAQNVARQSAARRVGDEVLIAQGNEGALVRCRVLGR